MKNNGKVHDGNLKMDYWEFLQYFAENGNFQQSIKCWNMYLINWSYCIQNLSLHCFTSNFIYIIIHLYSIAICLVSMRISGQELGKKEYDLPLGT